MKNLLLGILALAALAGGAVPAQAHERYFTYTYDWFTPAKNEKEVELWWTQSEGGNADGQVEFEYGITNRWMAAPYLLLKREHGGDFEVEGWKLEQRYRFGKFGYRRLLPAVYLEVAKEREQPYELEGKFITSYLFGGGWVWSNNFIFEGKVQDRAKTELAYAGGLSYPVTRKLRAGAELFGNWTEKEHFFGPTLGYKFTRDTKLLATAGFRYVGSTGGAVRLIFEKEW
jgi:opacity protein-like surface antigen